MKTADIRRAFLEYFSEQDHAIVSSSSLIPADDPTLLFTNAGMVQFKNIFLGLEKPPYTRATSVQRCVRAGGKHNDLENVGRTARHHTFFEMLGNFSFGDYFKTNAIRYAWELLTQVFGLPKERLWVTVFHEDHEAENIWLKEIGIDPKRFSRCGEKDNFWAMGDTGPCGPCTEIFYDHGPKIVGGPPGSSAADGDRYIEIWNLVFMQYERSAEGTLSQLPKPAVDTGMGLERIAAILQGVHNNYDIDLFQNLIHALRQLNPLTSDPIVERVIADHIRSSAFLVMDGIEPSNEGRGYVLRRIIRRALRYGHKAGFREPFFYKLVNPLSQLMGEAYPDLFKKADYISRVLRQEEEQFSITLAQGLQLLERALSQTIGSQLPGDVIFKLYDTYGFPVDLTADIAQERGFTLDQAGFERAMTMQREQSRKASQFSVEHKNLALVEDYPTVFEGYKMAQIKSTISQILTTEGKNLDQLAQGSSGIVILTNTPFYAEGGGQVGDQGEIVTESGRFKVEDTHKRGEVILHFGQMSEGALVLKQPALAEVNAARRKAIMLNHSATHLLHAALRTELGEHVIQKGSLVAPDRLRFDFSHYEPVVKEQLKKLEQLVNQQVRMNLAVNATYMPLAQAEQEGVMALFNEKYGEEVRVLSMGEFSKELCGGTHVERTGDIGFFKIISESGVAAGIRRIEAITGEAAISWVLENESLLLNAMEIVKSTKDNFIPKLQQTLVRQRELEKANENLRAGGATGSLKSDLLKEVVERPDGIKVLVKEVPTTDSKILRATFDQLKQQLEPVVIILVGVENNQCQVVAGMSLTLIKLFPPAADLVKVICNRGGGRPDLAQGGGDIPEDLVDRIENLTNQLLSY